MEFIREKWGVGVPIFTGSPKFYDTSLNPLTGLLYMYLLGLEDQLSATEDAGVHLHVDTFRSLQRDSALFRRLVAVTSNYLDIS